jgi:hypothetical protein
MTPFQDDLERRLRADPSLGGGRLERRPRASGGFTDLLHDGIVRELIPSAMHGPRATEVCAPRVGQPGAQFAILLMNFGVDREI